MDIFARFATDPNKEAEGTIMPLDDKTSLRVRRFANDDYLALNRTLRERHKVVLEGTDATAAEKAGKDILIEAMANCVLVGWEGVDFKDASLPYSVENAKMLLKLNDFRNFVFQASNNIENYRYEKLETTEKNSSAG